MAAEMTHTGTIAVVASDAVEVKIGDGAEKCGGCSVKFMCKPSGESGDMLRVPVKSGDGFAPGDRVRLSLAYNRQYSAALIALVFPCVVLLGGVAAGWAAGLDEGLCALCGLLLTAVYFLALFAVRKRVNRKFAWKIEKLK